MLLRQELSRRHHCCLISILHRQQRREQPDDSLPAPNIALQQTMHLPIAAHVGEDLANRPVLRCGQAIRQLLLERTGKLATVAKCNSGSPRASDSISAAVEEMDEE